MVHLANNPADEAAANYSNELDKLRAEVSCNLSDTQPVSTELAIFYAKIHHGLQIERYKRKVRRMEDEHDDLTSRLNETKSDNTTINLQEVSVTTKSVQQLPR